MVDSSNLMAFMESALTQGVRVHCIDGKSTTVGPGGSFENDDFCLIYRPKDDGPEQLIFWHAVVRMEVLGQSRGPRTITPV